MPLVLANRVQETGTANTTVSFTLTGAVPGFQSFATIGNTNTTYYSATDGSGNWEVGLGTYSTTGPTLTRTTVYASSNAGSAVTFSGSVSIFVTYPSGRSVNLNELGNVSALGTVSSGTWQGSTVGVAYGGTGVTSSTGANSVVLRDANGNITVNRISQELQTITASGGTTVLTAASDFNQRLVGTGNHTFRLPDATTLTDTTAFQFNNAATGILTIQDNATTVIGTVTPGGAANAVLVANATVAGTWEVHGYLPEGVTWGTNALALGTSVISGGTWQGGTIQSGYGGTGLTTFAGANNALYSTSASALAAGTLPIAAGGTGQTTRQAAMDALAGSVTSGQYLRGDGTDVVMSAIQAADVPTLNQNTTGTASNVTGTVAFANGGTGETTRQNAMDALAGAVTSGQYLRGNGTDVVMSAIQAADVPTLNQNTTGTAANVTGIVAVANGGTGTSTPSLVAGTNVTISGSFPNQTINASGGGGLTGFTAAESTAAPNATVFVDSLTASAASTDADVAFVAKGAGATLAQVPTATAAGGNKRGLFATDWQKSRTAATHVASGNSSVVGGGRNNSASGAGSFIGGGGWDGSTNGGNTASGTASVVAGGFNNTANRPYSFVVGGSNNNAVTAATGYNFVVGGLSNTCTTNYSIVVGGDSNSVTGVYGAVLGGFTNRAQFQNCATVVNGANNSSNGAFSFIGNGGSLTNAANGNTASSDYSAVVNGEANTASNQYAFIGSGSSNTANGFMSSIVGGAGNTSSGFISTVSGGTNNIANGDLTIINGGKLGTARSIAGYSVFPACNEPIAASNGVHQSAVLLLARQTTDATATRLTSNTSSAATTNQLILPNNSAYYFRGSVTSGVTGGGNSAMWTFEGGIKRGANAASTILIQSVINPVAADAGASTWIVALSADTTNGGLAVTVTGQASTTIRWVCKIETTEMTF